MSTTEEKTEQPTHYKLTQARKKGQVAKSQDVFAFLSLTFALFAIYFYEFAIKKYFAFLTSILSTQISIDFAMSKAIDLWFLSTLPVILCGMLGTLIAGFMQFGFLWAKLKISIEKINPILGLKNLFSKKRLVELLKQIIVFVAILLIIIIFLKNNYSLFFKLIYNNNYIENFFIYIFFELIKLVLICFLFIAIFDFIWQRYQFFLSMRMSKYEVKKEYKQQEGDPHLKQERKRVFQELCEQASVESIQDSSVILINPTHFAVALKYNEQITTPIVIAKGKGKTAQEIIKKAHAFNIKVVRNVSLARGLYLVDINQEIPEKYYEAVAEILIFITQVQKNENI